MNPTPEPTPEIPVNDVLAELRLAAPYTLELAAQRIAARRLATDLENVSALLDRLARATVKLLAEVDPMNVPDTAGGLAWFVGRVEMLAASGPYEPATDEVQ